MKKLFFFTFSFFVYSNFAFTQELDKLECDIVKKIGEKLGVASLEKDLCIIDKQGQDGVSIQCNCSFKNNTICHLTQIIIRSRDLPTTLPIEFTKLRYLQHLDLSLNYHSGTIPSEWATMRFRSLLIMGNRLSGPFPKALTRMTTLLTLNIQGNLFSGPIPQEIGMLNNLNELDLSSNEFTGELHVALAKLTSLISLRICDNNLSGKIPNFISEWTQIRTLHIQGCSFEGPFPSSMSALTQLNDLRISDLKGGASIFPSLEGVIGLEILILRNCLINGTIPNLIEDMKNLNTLDLSFNNLTGSIPSFFNVREIDHIYLTKNNLTGFMPGWVFSSTKDVDLSYNSFTWNASGPKSCDQNSKNMVESYSTSKQSNIHPCLRKDFPCTKPNTQQIFSLHINCGGDEININNTIRYEADSEKKGASPYYNAGNWAFSSTGYFLDDSRESDIYILSNTSNLHDISTFDSELYMTARRSAISLTYYGLCLMNGIYIVKLHFAEIVFTQYNSFNITGKRIFDVYVQEELKLKDFDIVKEAGGIGRAVVKTYIVEVKNNTLKIQLYWAGKGTTRIPSNGNYGPIISAISIHPTFKPPHFTRKINHGLIGGIVGGTFFVLLFIVLGWRKGYIKCGGTDMNLTDLRTGRFTFRQIKVATKNFCPSNKIGEGGFGVVYKGVLSDGTMFAVKQLSLKSKQGKHEFLNEIGVLSALQHPNLVRLYGSCVEQDQCMLVYEYMENNCLSRVLSERESKAKLTWPVRFEICIGIARGLVFLHEDSSLQIIHRDIKTSNILLDKNMNPKISDFGLAKLLDDGNTRAQTRVVGTTGYVAPEYERSGCLTVKADVFSFGVVALEIVTGKRNSDYIDHADYCYLLQQAWFLQNEGRLLELVDQDLASDYSLEEASTVLNVALLCAHGSYTHRPSMSETIGMLEGRTDHKIFQTNFEFSSMHPDSFSNPVE